MLLALSGISLRELTELRGTLDVLLGIAHLLSNNAVDALNCVKDNRNSASVLIQAISLLLQGKLDESSDRFDQLANQYKFEIATCLNMKAITQFVRFALVLANRTQNDPEAAVKSLEDANVADPSLIEVVFNLCFALERKGALDKRIALLDQLLNPKHGRSILHTHIVVGTSKLHSF